MCLRNNRNYSTAKPLPACLQTQLFHGTVTEPWCTEKFYNPRVVLSALRVPEKSAFSRPRYKQRIVLYCTCKLIKMLYKSCIYRKRQKLNSCFGIITKFASEVACLCPSKNMIRVVNENIQRLVQNASRLPAMG